jgi:hypothetical protein
MLYLGPIYPRKLGLFETSYKNFSYTPTVSTKIERIKIRLTLDGFCWEQSTLKATPTLSIP